MFSQELSIDTPIEDKIFWAESRFRAKRKHLLVDPKISELLVRFREAARASHREMGKLGLEDECRRCDEKEGGSCCGAGLENRYSGSLLLINLLLDLKLPSGRHDPRGCYFLQESGCSLLARHVICVNYMCKKLMDRFNPEMIASLREKEGKELDLLFFLDERVKELLKG